MGAYASALSVDISLLTAEPWVWPPNDLPGAPVNPVVGYFETADAKWIYLAMLQPGRYWADFCRHIEREDLIDDPRFDTDEKLIANAQEAAFIVQAELARARPLDDWIECASAISRGSGRSCRTSRAGRPRRTAPGDGLLRAGHRRRREAAPAPHQPDPVRRAPDRHDPGPQFAEHTDEVLAEFGYTEEEILQLKIDGAAT